MAHQRQVCHKGSAILAYISYKPSCITATRPLLHGFRVAYAGEYRASGDSPGLIGELAVPRHLSSPGSLLLASSHEQKSCALCQGVSVEVDTPLRAEWNEGEEWVELTRNADSAVDVTAALRSSMVLLDNDAVGFVHCSSV